MSSTGNEPLAARPHLKWAGGKAWLVEKHRALLPAPAPGGRYFEPFVGGGAVYYTAYAGTCSAVLSDANPRLIATYLAVRDHVEDLIAELRRHPYDRDHYYAIRDRLNREPDAPLIERAAWMFVINRHGFNGLYRESSTGDCNVSFGKPTKPGAIPVLCGPDRLRACSAALQGADIRCADFEDALAEAARGDTVFLDPPYVPASATANFTGYTAARFSSATNGQTSLLGPERTDQERLVDALHRLDRVGARFVLTNSATPETETLYQGWNVTRVKVSRSINSDTTKRGAVGEIIVTNFRAETKAA